EPPRKPNWVTCPVSRSMRVPPYATPAGVPGAACPSSAAATGASGGPMKMPSPSWALPSLVSRAPNATRPPALIDGARNPKYVYFEPSTASPLVLTVVIDPGAAVKTPSYWAMPNSVVAAGKAVRPDAFIATAPGNESNVKNPNGSVGS